MPLAHADTRRDAFADDEGAGERPHPAPGNGVQAWQHYLALEQEQNRANSGNGPRIVPARILPVPKTVSARLQDIIAAPYALPKWTAEHPQRSSDWKPTVDFVTDATLKSLRQIRQDLAVHMDRKTLGGVTVFELTPENLRDENAERTLLHLTAVALCTFREKPAHSRPR